jgi:hypothetical protein
VEDLEELKASSTYIVISRKEGIVYKRVTKNNKGKNKLTLTSDNPEYEPYQVDAEDVLEIWKAALVMSKPQPQQRWDVNQLASLVSDLHTQVNQLKRKVN